MARFVAADAFVTGGGRGGGRLGKGLAGSLGSLSNSMLPRMFTKSCRMCYTFGTLTRIKTITRYYTGLGALVLAAVCSLVGCSASAKPPAKPQPETTKQRAENQRLSGTLNLTTMIFPDPKHRGWLLWKITATELTGQPLGKGVQGALNSVNATLFQHGKPAASMFAPKAVYNSTDKQIAAGGGVFIKSLTEKGTTLRADKVIWSASTNKIVATGHVVFHDGKSGMVTTGPSLVADTVLKTLRVSQPGRTTLPKGF